jgi:hypothetical protein
MARNDLHSRRTRYFALSSQIAHMDTAHLHELFREAEEQRSWGRIHTLDIGQSKVFVKRLPVTEVEYHNMFSTKNLYDLPTYYNYGVGSAGFGVYRELVANIKATNWVLEGAITNFPLLYHYRMIPFSGSHPDRSSERQRTYVEYWNSNENIGRYMLDRAHAPYELVLFLEHMPYTIEAWLFEHPNKIDRVLEDMRSAITFLRKRGIVHFDANFENMLSDGEQAYLTDFGLVLDRRFALSEAEVVFLKQNSFYDYGELLWSLIFLLLPSYERLPEQDRDAIQKKYDLPDMAQSGKLLSALLSHIEAIHADGVLGLDPRYVKVLVKYRSVIALFHEFFFDMRGNKHKDTRLQHTRLARLLKETGFLT